MRSRRGRLLVKNPLQDSARGVSRIPVFRMDLQTGCHRRQYPVPTATYNLGRARPTTEVGRRKVVQILSPFRMQGDIKLTPAILRIDSLIQNMLS